MPYKLEYLVDLEKIINLVRENKTSNALENFELYLNSLYIGPYSKEEWRKTWRKKVYDFGELFSEKNNNHAGPFIEKINKLDNEKLKSADEAIQFMLSEIIWNYFPLEESYSANILKSLTKKYPCNPEFHHSYSLFLDNKGNYDLSIEEACLAFKIEPDNDFFYETCFNECKKYFNKLLLKGKTDEAENIIEKMEKIVKERTDPMFNNVIVSLRDRIIDHRIINKRIDGISGIAENIIEKERGKLIEIMGFFVAILGFVFINMDLAIKFLAFKDILLIMVGMGLILAFFATLISILFRKRPENFYKDLRFWLIFILVILFVIFVCIY